MTRTGEGVERAPFILCALALMFGYAALSSPSGVTPDIVLPVWWMVLVGLFAATIANATGAGAAPARLG